MNTEPDIASTSRQPARPVRPVQRVHGNTSDVESREAFWTPVYPVRLQNASSDGDASIRVRNSKFLRKSRRGEHGHCEHDQEVDFVSRTVLRSGLRTICNVTEYCTTGGQNEAVTRSVLVRNG